MRGWRGGPAYRGAPATEGLNGGHWEGAPIMRATHLSQWQTRRLFLTTPAHKPNTYSMDAVAVCLSSGDVLMMLLLCREPARTAMNCLPFTE